MSDKPTHFHNQPDPIDQAHVRGKFASQIGFLLAAVGSAIGLGNIWKFPYMLGENGGAAFIIVYLACIALVGLPVLIAEFVIGRRGQTSAIGSYRLIAPGKPWWLNGFLGILAAFVILSFYSAVAGWVLKYFVIGISEGFQGFTAEASGDRFGVIINEVTQPLIYQGIVMALTALIILFGIEKGIERASKILMPLLFVILVLLVIRSITLEGALEGVAFMLKPDFTKLSGAGVLAAMGQAFFTLSIGMGAMITYGSYVGKEINLVRTGAWVAGLDTLIALLAGFVIFPAVFAFGMEPSEGPGLVFVTLPSIFAEMPGGNIFGSAFFFLVFIAALTSAISILEPVVTWFVDDLNVKRYIASLIAGTAVFLVGIPACLSATGAAKLGDFTIPFLGGPVTFFDLLDKLSSQFMLPIGGLVTCLFLLIGWNRKDAIAEAAGAEGRVSSPFLRIWYILAVTVAPLGILAVLINGILALIRG